MCCTASISRGIEQFKLVLKSALIIVCYIKFIYEILVGESGIVAYAVIPRTF